MRSHFQQVNQSLFHVSLLHLCGISIFSYAVGDAWRRLCLSLFPFLQAPSMVNVTNFLVRVCLIFSTVISQIAFGSRIDIKMLTIGYAYLGYIIEDSTDHPYSLYV